MKTFDLIKMCFRSLFRRKLRTLLTVTGVIIGTCSIVVMISLGVGMNKAQNDMLKQMGDLTVINIYNYNNKGGESKQVLDDTALQTIKNIENVEVVTPFYRMNIQGEISILSGRYKAYGNIVGVYPEALTALGYELKEGRLLQESQGENFLLFGEKAAYQFMDTKKRYNNMVWPEPDKNGNIKDPFVDVMHDRLSLELNVYDDKGSSKKKEFRVKACGLLKEDFSKGYETSYAVFADVAFIKKLEQEFYKLSGKRPQNTKNSYNDARVKVKNMSDVEAVENAIKEMGFETSSMESIRKPMQEQARKNQLILGGIGAISLLVAALGITNTMIMSIYERTKEIGVMKVLGCKISNIRTSFLCEAGSIGFLGGIAGVLLSYGLSYGLNKILGSGNPGGGDMIGGFVGGMGGTGASQVSIIPLWLVGLAIIFATLIGLISGFYPANRAVKISALEAIKHE